MNRYDEPLDPRLAEKIAVLQPLPARDPRAAARGRANFLAQAQSLAATVSPTEKQRHKGWFNQFQTLLYRKEPSPMFTVLTSIALIAALLLGGGGATVYAAQQSLPEQPLYCIKTLSEDLRADFAAQPEDRLELALQFAMRRVEEMIALHHSGLTPPGYVLERFQMQLDGVFELVAGLDDPALGPALERVRRALQQRELALGEIEGAGPVLSQARQMVQERLRLVDLGLQDPQAFREQFRERRQLRIDAGMPTARPSQTPGASGGGPERRATGSPTVGSQYGHGQLHTPDENEGYGPGPHHGSTPTPGASGLGPAPYPSQAPDDGSGPGPGPYVTGTPTPGSGYGPVPGPEPICDCTPGSGPGPGEGNGEPGSGSSNQDGGQQDGNDDQGGSDHDHDHGSNHGGGKP